MMSYGFGFDPNGYELLDLQIDFKQLGRNCKALLKKAGRKVRQKSR